MLKIYSVLNHLRRMCSIFALSSGAPPAAISIVRVSGNESRRCLEELTGRQKIIPRELFFTTIQYRGDVIDRCMAVFLPGPKTSTGEDIVEFHVHGSRAVVDCLLDVLTKLGNLRPAKAGEFTKRAFYNGKMTLNEVQTLAHLLSARTQRQRRLSLRCDTLGKAMHGLRQKLIEIRATVEASIDFGDDVEFQWKDIHCAVSSVINELISIQERVHRGILINEGLKIVILGQANVGKSSLFNRLVQREAAIVSDIEGTTRDSLEAVIQVCSISAVLTDTAGIRSNPSNPIEAEGIRRTLKRAEDGDIMIVVLDSSVCDDVELEVHSIITRCHLSEGTRLVIVLNKCDLRNIEHSLALPWPTVKVSCTLGTGIDTLLQILHKQIEELCPVSDDNILLSNQIHRLLMKKALLALKNALDAKDVAVVAEMLRDATDVIGEVSGAVVNEQVLDQIFSSFCIGK